MIPKRFALVGAAGFIAPRHMRAIRDTGNELVTTTDPHDNVGVIDSIAPNARHFTHFEQFHEFIADQRNLVTTRLHYLSVCTPNHLHRAHTTAGLRLGCDVICEKPLVPTIGDLRALRRVEEETDQRVHTILQLRHHPAITALRDHTRAKGGVADVNLTYVTSRGRWYQESWKADPNRGFGVITNIGIHFFDMLHFVFGDVHDVELHQHTPTMAAGVMRLDHANVRWLLSIDPSDLPPHVRGHKTTYRNITVNNQEIEFSEGFTDLHTTSYEAILAGRGFGIDDAEASIRITETLRNLTAPATPPQTSIRPLDAVAWDLYERQTARAPSPRAFDDRGGGDD